MSFVSFRVQCPSRLHFHPVRTPVTSLDLISHSDMSRKFNIKVDGVMEYEFNIFIAEDDVVE